MAHTFTSSNFKDLVTKVNKLMDKFKEMEEQNNKLKKDSGKSKATGDDQTYLKKMGELEEELSRLKRKNKTLKEKDKLIRNKIERLAVKLDKLPI
jgi:DNA repair exonuclease SbcCD ATPase subunit